MTPKNLSTSTVIAAILMSITATAQADTSQMLPPVKFDKMISPSATDKCMQGKIQSLVWDGKSAIACTDQLFVDGNQKLYANGGMEVKDLSITGDLNVLGGTTTLKSLRITDSFKMRETYVTEPEFIKMKRILATASNCPNGSYLKINNGEVACETRQSCGSHEDGTIWTEACGSGQTGTITHSCNNGSVSSSSTCQNTTPTDACAAAIVTTGTVCADGTVYVGMSSYNSRNYRYFTTQCDLGSATRAGTCGPTSTQYKWVQERTPLSYTCTCRDTQGRSVSIPATATTNCGGNSLSYQSCSGPNVQYEKITEKPLGEIACDDLISNGYSDWEIPTDAELNIMYQNKDAIKNFRSDNTHYWSALSIDRTLCGGANSSCGRWRHWHGYTIVNGVRFSDGKMQEQYSGQPMTSHGVNHYARCVRRQWM